MSEIWEIAVFTIVAGALVTLGFHLLTGLQTDAAANKQIDCHQADSRLLLSQGPNRSFEQVTTSNGCFNIISLTIDEKINLADDMSPRFE